MFTGLIEEVGRIEQLENGRGTSRMTVTAVMARKLKKGDSVAVSGVCVTAVEVGPKSFAADLAQETLSRTSLSHARKGALVNLELPMKSGARVGGHVVQGHVDGTGKVLSLVKIKGKDDYWLRVSLPADLQRYVVEKGSIAIEGISLTVAQIRDDELSVAIIPHTYKATNLSSIKSGDSVNVEVDVLAKYAEKMAKGTGQKSSLTIERLMEEGF
jgi:riboflavin synthase